MSETPERTALYRIRGEEDALLYIGISNCVPIRWNGHERVQPWWDELRTLTVEWYETRPEAEAAEKAAILAEQPKYNVTYLKPGRGRRVRGNGDGDEKPGFRPAQHGLAVILPRDDDDRLINKQDIGAMVRMTPSEVASVLKRAEGPAGFMLGTQQLWRKGEIRQWIADMEASQKAACPSQAGAA